MNCPLANFFHFNMVLIVFKLYFSFSRCWGRIIRRKRKMLYGFLKSSHRVLSRPMPHHQCSELLWLRAWTDDDAEASTLKALFARNKGFSNYVEVTFFFIPDNFIS